MTLLGAADAPSCYSRLVNDWVCLDYVSDRQQEIVDATVQHIGITVVSVLLGLVIAFPLALLARRLPRLESAILAVTTGIYTVPSLALFPLLVPFTGLTATTVVIGLALYALTILVRSLLEGLRSVPDEVRESATGLGYSRGPLPAQDRAAARAARRDGRAAGRHGVDRGADHRRLAGGLRRTGQPDQGRRAHQLPRRALHRLACCASCSRSLLDALLVLAQRMLTPWTRGLRA